MAVQTPVPRPGLPAVTRRAISNGFRDLDDRLAAVEPVPAPSSIPLGALFDVDPTASAPTPTDEDVLLFDTASGLWQPRTGLIPALELLDQYAVGMGRGTDLPLTTISGTDVAIQFDEAGAEFNSTVTLGTGANRGEVAVTIDGFYRVDASLAITLNKNNSYFFAIQWRTGTTLNAETRAPVSLQGNDTVVDITAWFFVDDVLAGDNFRMVLQEVGGGGVQTIETYSMSAERSSRKRASSVAAFADMQILVF